MPAYPQQGLCSAGRHKQGFDMADEYSVLPIKIGLFANEARPDRARLLGLTR